MADQEKKMKPDSGNNKEQAMNEQSLEEIFVKLDELIAGMENDDVSLEDTFGLYHKGMDMLKICSDKIDRIEKKMLVLDEEGETHEF